MIGVKRMMAHTYTSSHFQAAESGNLDDFVRLYHGDNTRLGVKDARGRTAVHQASARNRVNILQFIQAQQGGKYIVLNNK